MQHPKKLHSGPDYYPNEFKSAPIALYAHVDILAAHPQFLYSRGHASKFAFTTARFIYGFD